MKGSSSRARRKADSASSRCCSYAEPHPDVGRSRLPARKKVLEHHVGRCVVAVCTVFTACCSMSLTVRAGAGRCGNSYSMSTGAEGAKSNCGEAGCSCCWTCCNRLRASACVSGAACGAAAAALCDATSAGQARPHRWSVKLAGAPEAASDSSMLATGSSEPHPHFQVIRVLLRDLAEDGVGGLLVPAVGGGMPLCINSCMLAPLSCRSVSLSARKLADAFLICFLPHRASHLDETIIPYGCILQEAKWRGNGFCTFVGPCTKGSFSYPVLPSTVWRFAGGARRSLSRLR